MFCSFAAIYFIGILLMIVLNLVPKSKEEERSKPRSQSSSVTSVMSDLNKVLSEPFTLLVIGFVSFYKLCERAEQSFSLFMIDKKVPMTQLAFWSTVMRTGSLLGKGTNEFIKKIMNDGLFSGSTYSGWMLRKVDAKTLIVRYSAFRLEW